MWHFLACLLHANLLPNDQCSTLSLFSSVRLQSNSFLLILVYQYWWCLGIQPTVRHSNLQSSLSNLLRYRKNTSHIHKYLCATTVSISLEKTPWGTAFTTYLAMWSYWLNQYSYCCIKKVSVWLCWPGSECLHLICTPFRNFPDNAEISCWKYVIGT